MAIKYGSERAIDQSHIKQLKQINENFKEEIERLLEVVNDRRNDYDALLKQVIICIL